MKKTNLSEKFICFSVDQQKTFIQKYLTPKK